MCRKNILYVMLFLSAFALSDALKAQNINKFSALWCDPLKSFEHINSRNGVIDILEKAKNSGFNAVVLGVKANTGEVLYPSEIAPRLSLWKGIKIPVGFDPVRTFLDEGRHRDLQIYVVFPIFTEANFLEQQGTLYAQHPEWQTTVYVVHNEEPQLMPVSQWAYGPVGFANPHLAEVRNYEISLVKEFLDKYTVDGIIFDQGRYYGIEADFSETTRQQFATYIGATDIDWWPDDVYSLQYVNDKWEVVPGRHFLKWIEFRANTIKQFYQQLVEAVDQKDATLPVGNFVGAWYPTYYEHGVNWASETNLPEENWASRDYYKTGIAELFDFLVVGCFFGRVGMDEAQKVGADWWMSVEGSATLANEVVRKVSPVYGSLLMPQFSADKEAFKKALRTTLNLTEGLYIHEFSEIEKNNYWTTLRETLTFKHSEGVRPRVNDF